MPWWVASLIANVGITVIEYLYRTAQYPNFLVALKYNLPLIIMVQFGIFYAWRDAPSFMFAWAFFFCGNVLMRLVSTQFFVGESLTWATSFGVGFIFVGAYFIKVGS